MANTPRRTIRIEDELWTAAGEKAAEEGTTVTEVIRESLARYVGAALLLVLAVLGLSACGGAGPTAQPVSSERAAADADGVITDEEAEAIVDAERQADRDAREAERAAARQERHDIEVRVAKGECHSESFGSTEGTLGAMYDAIQPLTGQARVDAIEAMIAAVPPDSEACSDGDLTLFRFYRDEQLPAMLAIAQDAVS